MLTLPSAAEMAAHITKNVDCEILHEARNYVVAQIAKWLFPLLNTTFENSSSTGPYRPDVSGTSRRALRYVVLTYIAASEPQTAAKLARNDWLAAKDLSTETGAIAALLGTDHPERDQLLHDFHNKHQDDPLILDKWLMMNAMISDAHSVKRVADLLQHADFSITTPNRVYALVGGFSSHSTGFHSADGSGYKLVADVIIQLNGINPQVAARMATGFRSWALYDAPRRKHASAQMERILAVPALSSDVFEIISRTLKS
jgi:aminopeptidase N